MDMKKDFVCKGCKQGPCNTNESAVRPVLTDYCRSYQPSSDWWKYYDFTRVYQCIDVINTRTDIFQCDGCGFLPENHMLHIVNSGTLTEWQLCPDCYERLKAQVGSTDNHKVG